MPIYFGLYISCNEAYYIFGLDIKTQININKVKYNLPNKYHYEFYLITELNNYFSTYFLKIRIFIVDKSKYIIGYELKEFSDFSNKLISFSEILIELSYAKIKFQEEMQILNANCKNITLKIIEK